MPENSTTIFDYINLYKEISRIEKLNSSDRVLYFHILIEANRRFWDFPLNISNRLLVFETGMDESTIIRSRNRLKQLGLIDFKSGVTKQISPKYWLLKADYLYVASNLASNPACNVASNPANIYKDIIHNTKDNITPLSPEGEILEKNLEKKEDFPNDSLHTQEEKEKIVPPKKEKEDSDWRTGLDTEWIALVEKWLAYKKTKNQSYKSNDSILHFVKKLQQLSGGNINTAKELVSTSIAYNWAGVFAQKNFQKPKINTIQKPNVIGKF